MFTTHRAIVGGTEPPTIITDGLTARYALDGNTGASPVGTNDGTAVGSPGYISDGRGGQAIALNGTSQLANVPFSSDFNTYTNGNFSLCARVRPNSATTGGPTLLACGWVAAGNHAGWVFYLSGGKLKIYIRAANGTTQNTTGNSVLPSSVFTAVGMSFGAGQIEMYVDGTNDHSTYLSFTASALFADNYPFLMGANNSTDTASYTGHYPGALDDVRFYNRVLTPAEYALIANWEG